MKVYSRKAAAATTPAPNECPNPNSKVGIPASAPPVWSGKSEQQGIGYKGTAMATKAMTPAISEVMASEHTTGDGAFDHSPYVRVLVGTFRVLRPEECHSDSRRLQEEQHHECGRGRQLGQRGHRSLANREGLPAPHGRALR